MDFNKIRGYIIGRMLINGTYAGRGCVEVYENDEHFDDINEYFKPFVDGGKINKDRVRSNNKYKIKFISSKQSIKGLMELEKDLENIPGVWSGVLVAILNNCKEYIYTDTYHASVIQNLMLSVGLEFVPHIQHNKYPGPLNPTVLDDSLNNSVINAGIVELSGVNDSVRLYRKLSVWRKFLSDKMGLNAAHLLSHEYLNDDARAKLIEYINVEYHPNVINQINQQTVSLGGFPIRVVNKSIADSSITKKVEVEPHLKSSIEPYQKKNQFNDVSIPNNFFKNSDGNYMCKECSKIFLTIPQTHLCEKQTHTYSESSESGELVIKDGVVARIKDRVLIHPVFTNQTHTTESPSDYIKTRETIRLEQEYLEKNVMIPTDRAINELEINKAYMEKTYIGEALSEFREDARKEKQIEGKDIVDIDPVKDIFIKHGKKWESEGITINGRIVDRPRYERAFREYNREKKERLDSLGISLAQYEKMADVWYQLETKEV